MVALSREISSYQRMVRALSDWLALIITAALLAVNAFFVAGEFAVTSTRRSQIEPLVAQGKRGAKAALWAVEHVSLVLAVTQLGITLASTGLGAVAEPAVAHLIVRPLEFFAVPSSLTHPIAFVLALVIVVFLHILLGEMIPKNLTVAASVQVCLAVSPLLVRIARTVRPVVHALDSSANWFVKLFGVTPRSEVSQSFTIEEVAAIVEKSTQAGTLRDELGLLSGSLEFSTEDVREAMVPRSQLVTLSWPLSAADFEAEVAKTGFSRFPISDKSGELTGYLHIKDVIFADSIAAREAPLEDWRIRVLPEVSPDEEVEDALRLMQKTGVHLAQVIENGQCLGAIFLEDILEELVGEVRDTMQRKESL